MGKREVMGIEGQAVEGRRFNGLDVYAKIAGFGRFLLPQTEHTT